MSKRRRKLTPDQRAEVVVRLACYDFPSAIAKSLKEDFGIEISRQGIEQYDPTRVAGRRCSEEWATLFHETRRKLVEGKADIGVAHKMVRIRWLDRMAREKMAEGNTAEVRALLKQAADEVSQMAGQRGDESGADCSKLGRAELDARIVTLVARLGFDVVESLSIRTVAGGDDAAAALPAPDEPVSG